MPESQLRQRIRQRLQRVFPDALVMGWPGNAWSGSGWPDLLYLEWPLLLGLEVKQGRRSKATPVQGARHSLLRRHHVPVYVVHTPDEACGCITSLKEKIPMAFDPSLLAELEAALGEEPTAALAPEPIPDTPLDPDTLDLDASDNGTVVLDPDAPAPDIEELTAAIVASGEVAAAQADAALDLASVEADILVMLNRNIESLTDAVNTLSAMLADETPRPRGRRRAS